MSNGQNRGEPLLRVEHLKKYFPVRNSSLFFKNGGTLYAVDDVSFTVNSGETFSLVGESGCGKTTVGKTVLQLYPPTAGEVYFEGKNLIGLKTRELREIRSNMQMVFQDPNSSLNPRMTIYESIADIIKIHHKIGREVLSKRVYELLDMVGLPSWFAERYPHEFSGGQLQRACIARALALNPKFIVCDEPVSALDVSIQSQVLNLLSDLKKELLLSYLFISHGLPAVKHISDRIAVMYLGRIIEQAHSAELFANPLHPYTQALISAVPVPDPDKRRERIVLEGDVPSPIHPPKGCRFCTRCRYATDLCHAQEPQLKEVKESHFVACHLCKGSV